MDGASEVGRGECVSIRLEVEGQGAATVQGEVVYTLEDYEVEPGRRCTGLGVRFIDLPPAVEAMLGMLIETEREAGRLLYDSQGKRAVDEAWKLSQFLRSVVDNTSILLGVFDEHEKLVLWNRFGEEISGYTLQELDHQEQMWALLFSDPNQRQLISRQARSVIERNTAAEDLEMTTTTKSGSHRIVSWSLRGLYEGEAPIGLIVTGRDVTLHREIEAQLRQAGKLEALGRLAGGVAHDFNNILTAIMGYCELLSSEVDDDPRIEVALDGIMGCAKRAAGLTGQLLAICRKQLLNPVQLDLNELVVEAESMLVRLIGEDVELRTALAPEPCRVEADRTQLLQVLLNLVVNARDALPDGGAIRIETQRVELDEDWVSRHDVGIAGRYAMVAVGDNGQGMDDETAARIFEPFFTTKDPGSGTGLGLATVFGIVKQSKGFIWVYSEPGEGSTFKVFIPERAEAGNVAVTTSVAEDVPHGWETVLLVEDDDNVRRTLSRALGSRGYTVLEARDGLEAQVIGERQRPIHLLLTDVVLPGLSGPQAAAAICRDHPETRVIYMSGFAGHLIATDGSPALGRILIQKPFASSHVLRKLREVLDG